MRIALGDFYLEEDFTVSLKKEHKEKIVSTMKTLTSSEDSPINIEIYADELGCFDKIVFKEQETKDNIVYYHKDLGFFKKRVFIRRIVAGANFKYNVEFKNTESLLQIINDLTQYAIRQTQTDSILNDRNLRQ